MEFIDEYVFGRYHPIFPILWGSTITFLGAWLIYRGAKKFYTVSDQNDFLQYATDQFYWLSIVVCFLFNLKFGHSVLARSQLVRRVLTTISTENNTEDMQRVNYYLLSILSKGLLIVELIMSIVPYTIYFAYSYDNDMYSDETKENLQLVFVIICDILNTYIMLLWVWLNISAKILSEFAIDNKINVETMNNRSALLAFVSVSDEMHNMTEGWTANNIMRLIFGVYWVFYFFINASGLLQIPQEFWDDRIVLNLIFFTIQIVLRFSALVVLAAAPGYVNVCHIFNGRKNAKKLMKKTECDFREVLSFLAISESIADEDGMLYCGVPMTLEKVSYIFTALGVVISSAATTLNSY